MRSIAVILCLLTLALSSYAQDDDWEEWGDDEWSEVEEGGLQWNGFFELALGSRWDRDPQVERKQTLGDMRFRLETDWSSEKLSVGFKGDAWYDSYLEEFDGELRDLSLSFSPSSNLDMKLGRQVLTWGTGDLLFLNDLFPKDWVSFFAGRDDEYLKAPSNAVRATWYGEIVNVDLAWTPVFESDEYLTGERFSFFSPLAGQRIAPSPPLSGIEPDKDIDNGEVAVRLFKTFGGTEMAMYAYHGFFHQPTAFTDTFQPTFAPLTSIGASVRRPLGVGLFNAEAVYYASRDDRSGSDPYLPNDQARLLLGYEREAITNFTVAFQYYLEWTQDYSELLANSLAPVFEPDEYRHVVTGRLNYRLNQDKLTLSLFTFYSPSDNDFYLRPSVTYRYSDQWSVTGGASIFGGDDAHTFFNQFADNSNAYIRVRYNY
tara:strand:+ start:8836 stop:10125 length:1290 start_codon:yes stop_codon:yes gene_type:complete